MRIHGTGSTVHGEGGAIPAAVELILPIDDGQWGAWNSVNFWELVPSIIAVIGNSSDVKLGKLF